MKGFSRKLLQQNEQFNYLFNQNLYYTQFRWNYLINE
jgi:hypothetical protein